MSKPVSNINQHLGDDEVELIDYLRVIAKHKVFIALFISLCTAIGYGYSTTFKPLYISETTIMPIDSGSGGNTSELSGLAKFAGISVPSRSDSKEKMLTILKSRTFMEKLVIDKNLLPILFADKWDKESNSWKKEITSPPLPIDGAYYLLGTSKISSEVPIIKISVESEDPESASLIANGIAQSLNEELQEKKYTLNQLTLEFVKKQLDINKKRLETAEEEFVSFQKSNKVLQVSSQADKSIELLSGYISLKEKKEMEISSMKKFINSNDFNIRFLETDILGIDKKIKELEGRKNGSIIIPVGLAPEIILEFERKKRDVENAAKIYGMLLEKYEFLKIEETKDTLSFQIIDAAIPPSDPFKPNKRQIVMLAFFASSFIGCFIIFFREYLRKMN